MPTPTVITDLSQTAASNYPAGTDSPSVLDDVQRAHAAFIALLRDGKGQSSVQTIAGGGTTDIGGVNSQFVEVTGTPLITSFGTNYTGVRFVRFTGAAVITHNATLINLPGAANITTASGDCLIAVPNSTGNGWNVTSYARAAGVPATVGGDIGAATATTPGASDNDTSVATTAFVQGELTSQAVKLTGNQTIAGTKTFSTQPVLPNAPALQTLTATASGTGVEFTSIPSWVKKITVMMHGTSTNGSSNLRFQIGPSGGVETSGYLSSSAIGTTYGLDAGGFSLTSNITSASISSGIATFVLTDSATNLWAYSANLGYSNAAGASYAGGSKALAGTLSRLKLTTVNGADTFDAGSINILWE